ncbi:MAG TPA: AI-2E family transporter, partial [Gemmatimonadaceae bacterium]
MTSTETKGSARARAPHAASAGVTARDVWIVLINTLALVVGVYLVWKLRLFVSWLLVALVLALALEPAVEWLGQHGFRRGWAVLLVFTGLIALLTLLLVTVIPMLIDQGRALVSNAP